LFTFLLSFPVVIMDYITRYITSQYILKDFINILELACNAYNIRVCGHLKI